MKKFYRVLIFSFLLHSPVFFSQIKSSDIINRTDGIDIHLKFDKVPFIIQKENGKEILEYGSAIDESSPGAPVLPSRTFFVAIPPYSKVSPTLINKKESFISGVNIKANPVVHLKEEIIEYENTNLDPKYFISDEYPLSDVSVVGYIWIREYYCAVIQINTHKYNWKRKEITELFETELRIYFIDVKPFNLNTEVKSLFDKSLSKVILNYEYADEFRSFRIFSDTTGSWIDYDNEYVKLGISEDGIYKISYNDLLNYGINPASINPLTFKIYFEGKQIPLFISGENDLSFDQGDYIEFWGEKNYGSTNYAEIVSQGEDYKNYLDIYNDTNFVWLTWGDENGLKVDSIYNLIPGLTDTVKTHEVKLHLEKDVRLKYYDSEAARVQLPDWQENKVWTWHFLGNSGSISYNFDSPDFVQGTVINIIARLISDAADNIILNAHKYGSSLNSTSPLDTIVFNFKQTVNFISKYSSSTLNQTDNIYRVFGLPNQVSFHQTLIDWVDINFYRENKAVNDSLMITVPDSVLSSERVLVVSNISDSANIILYKVKPLLKRITAFNFSSGTLTFTDTVSGGDKYLVIKDEYKITPRFVIKKFFENLRGNSRIADYIILSNKKLEESANQYADFIEANYLLNTELILINDIYDEFSFGLDNAKAIRDFLFAANQYWQFPKPSYLNIIGDANYDYKNIVIPPTNIIKENLVSAYGNPVSDTWFVTWDSANVNIPQMFVGRIPATNNNEVLFYLEKHQTYINRGYDNWNKNYLFFSGGDINEPGQLAQIKNANDNVLSQLVTPKPIGGSGIHFYKTINPTTNYGPYTLSQVNEAIDNGGVFISYIGHSGTQTWDNGITSINDLKNSFPDRNPLVTDFGCSTGKFAEPDIDAFGELFLTSNPSGQAINYLGNSSWGYLSTSLQFPELFYSQLLIDSASSVGEAHLKAKMNMFSQSGFTDVNRVFNYCNFLFGDPLIKFKTPEKPNLSVKENSFTLLPENPNELTDSVTLIIEILNAGRVIGDSFKVSVINRWFNEIIYQTERTLPLPLFSDTLIITIPVAGRVGQHLVDIDLDTQNSIDEIYEDDNAAQFVYYVFSTSVRPLETERFYNTKRDSLIVLNPVIISEETLTEVVVSISDNPAFNNASEISKTMDSVLSVINLSNLQNNKRYWWRTKLNSTSQEWSGSYSFYNTDKDFNWYSGAESFNKQDFEFHNTEFDSSDNSWKLNMQENILKVLSAGFNAGSFASVLYNGQEFLPNTYFWGIATAEIDSFSLQPYNIKYFLYSEPPTTADSMIAYLESLPEGKLLAMAICDDGAQSVLGFSKGTPVRRAIEGFGSLYVDSVGYRDSWCMIGKKGAPTGTVLESFKIGPDIAETGDTVITSNQQGYILFPSAGKSFNWLNIEKEDSTIPGSSIDYIPIGIKQNGDADTLEALTFSGNIALLNHIDAAVYPSLKILAGFNANEFLESPSLSSIGINYTKPPELAINYQVVSVNPDSLFVGGDVKLNFAVYNSTETPADSFKVLVEILKSNNERSVIANIPVDELDSLGKKYFEVQVNTLNYIGNNSFMITVDSENEVPEIFEDNNFFQVPFYVRPDTSVPSINITIDGADIIDGDYVSANPEINIELFDPSLLPLNDTSSISLLLNDEEIYFANNPEISYQFSPSNPKMTVIYNPSLSTGEYTLKVFGKNAAGSVVDSAGIEKYFIVNEETEILNVYNYPNPSKGETYFTFKLTQIPDELKIKIYTVAGRLIKEIKKISSELNFDFNTIHWDGKDDDKNFVANGVYLYKVIISKDGKNQDVTEKLAIVR